MGWGAGVFEEHVGCHRAALVCFGVLQRLCRRFRGFWFWHDFSTSKGIIYIYMLYIYICMYVCRYVDRYVCIYT